MIRFDFLSRFLIAGAIGICLAIIITQNDERFKKNCEKKIKQIFEETFSCKVQEGHIESINFFTGRVIGKNIKICALDDSWFWQAPLLELKVPWLFSIINKKIGLEISLKNMEAHSQFSNGRPAIVDHIHSMIDGPEGMPVMLKSLSLNETTFRLDHEIDLHSSFNLSIDNRDDGVKISCAVLDGSLLNKKNVSLNKISGSCVIEKETGESIPIFTCNLKCKPDRVLFDDDTELIINAKSDGENIVATLGTLNNPSFVHAKGKARSFSDYYLVIDAEMLVSSLMKALGVQDHAQFCKGTGSVTAKINQDAAGCFVDCSAHLKEASYNNFSLGSIDVAAKLNDARWQGLFSIMTPLASQLNGSFGFDQQTMAGSFDCALAEMFAIEGTQWQIESEGTQITANYDNRRGLEGSYVVHLKNRIDHSLREISGTMHADGSAGTLQGRLGEASYCAQFVTNAAGIIIDGSYKNKEKELIKISCSEDKIVQGEIDYQIIRNVLKEVFNISVKGEGKITLSAQYKNGLIEGNIKMVDGTIQLTPTYNFIKKINAEISLDFAKRALSLRNVGIDLLEGSIKTERAAFMLDSWGRLQFMHIPCVLERVFFNIEKECFVVISGNSLFYKNDDQTTIYGRLVLDKGQLKKNIFSLITSKQHIAPFKTPFEQTAFDGDLDIALMTRKPLSVKTSFLDTDAALNWQVKGTVREPLVTGKILLSRGLLNFPYKPLFITQGKIFFVPPHLFDPEITLVAKGRIRHYDLTLRIGGSVEHPHINFESTPPLTEEQIITLLLIGSESGSLSLIMPTLIMNNVQHLLFGPEQSISKLESYFKSLLTPLKNIRIVPSFTDQSARGGLRGAIEIDVNDQLHGLVQKNFSQLEDTKFEVEYYLSDDITLRAIKDEHGDLGGELEVKWKF
ncbi:translocation/assembly module TamB domain-containing protein [Candidatus Dependentiae bacterium]|nr:translocation/assembly module TamB domain-containing protein [Candidatus Dependentiae bacterium]